MNTLWSLISGVQRLRLQISKQPAKNGAEDSQNFHSIVGSADFLSLRRTHAASTAAICA